MKQVISSDAEAKLGALFVNAWKVKIQQLTLEEMGHPQPPTPIHCDNSTAAGICTGTVKLEQLRVMDMICVCMAYQQDTQNFDVQ